MSRRSSGAGTTAVTRSCADSAIGQRRRDLASPNAQIRFVDEQVDAEAAVVVAGGGLRACQRHWNLGAEAVDRFAARLQVAGQRDRNRRQDNHRDGPVGAAQRARVTDEHARHMARRLDRDRPVDQAGREIRPRRGQLTGCRKFGQLLLRPVGMITTQGGSRQLDRHAQQSQR
jgi:hypothetical protein